MSETTNATGTTSAANKGAKVESYHGWTNGQLERDAGVPAAETVVISKSVLRRKAVQTSGDEQAAFKWLAERGGSLSVADIPGLLVKYAQHVYAAQSQEIAQLHLDKQWWKSQFQQILIKCCDSDRALTAEHERSAKLREALGDRIAVLKLRSETHVKYIQTSENPPNGYAAVLVPDWQVKQWLSEFALLASSPAEGSDYCNSDETAELLNREDKAQAPASGDGK